MPICKRSIEPVNISRKEVLKGADELECVSNDTMVHIVLQLSSLSKLAEDLFSELHLETCQLFYRTCRVTQQVELLKHQIIGLNPTAEEVSLRDINQRKPFKNMIQKDQEIITVMTRPTAIKEVYNNIDPPPTLFLLDPYREDGKESMKFYTDPDYFFELWKQEVAKDAKNQMKKQKSKLKRRPTKDLDPIHDRQNADNSKMSDDFHPGFPEQVHSTQNIGFPNQRSVMNDQGARLMSSRIARADNLSDVSHQMVPDGWSSIINNNRLQIDQSYNQFLPAALNYGYKLDGHSGMKQGGHDQYSAPRVQQEFEQNDGTSQNFLSTSFPSPNLNSSSSEPMNDSNYFPPPPASQYLVEAHITNDQNITENNEGFNFSEGVQDLLNLIEGTPPRNIDAINGNPIQGDNSGDTSGIRNKTPTFPADIPSPLKSPPKHFTTIISPTSSISLSKGGGIGGSFKHREVSPENLNSSNQRIVRDTRSDLLEAIRKGIQLRKVEERRIISERRTTARVDVQSIMEAAFELRRKAMEGNDSEEEDETIDWSDEA